MIYVRIDIIPAIQTATNTYFDNYVTLNIYPNYEDVNYYFIELLGNNISNINTICNISQLNYNLENPTKFLYYDKINKIYKCNNITLQKKYEKIFTDINLNFIGKDLKTHCNTICDFISKYLFNMPYKYYNNHIDIHKTNIKYIGYSSITNTTIDIYKYYALSDSIPNLLHEHTKIDNNIENILINNLNYTLFLYHINDGIYLDFNFIANILASENMINFESCIEYTNSRYDDYFISFTLTNNLNGIIKYDLLPIQLIIKVLQYKRNKNDLLKSIVIILNYYIDLKVFKHNPNNNIYANDAYSQLLKISQNYDIEAQNQIKHLLNKSKSLNNIDYTNHLMYFILIIKNDEIIVKIGYSKTFNTRITQLKKDFGNQMHLICDLKVIKSELIEKDVHAQIAKLNPQLCYSGFNKIKSSVHIEYYKYDKILYNLYNNVPDYINISIDDLSKLIFNLNLENYDSNKLKEFLYDYSLKNSGRKLY